MGLTKEFMAAGNRDLKLTEDKVFLIYKFDETPESMILQAIETMGDKDQARAYFKGIARFVHPDKNGHPLANSVFQKISNALALSSAPTIRAAVF